jgi:hypothetical protein
VEAVVDRRVDMAWLAVPARKLADLTPRIG